LKNVQWDSLFIEKEAVACKNENIPISPLFLICDITTLIHEVSFWILGLFSALLLHCIAQILLLVQSYIGISTITSSTCASYSPFTLQSSASSEISQFDGDGKTFH